MMRGHSTPHEYVPKIVPKTEVALALARAQSIVNRKSLPPASVRRPRVIVKPRYRAHIPVRASISSNTSSREEFESDTVEHTRRAPLSILAYLRYLQLRLLSKHSKPYASYVPIAAYRKVTLRIVWQTIVLLTLFTLWQVCRPQLCVFGYETIQEEMPCYVEMFAA